MNAPALDDLAAGEVHLDPFAYQPGKASGIAGLGQGDRHDDPGYAFHTDYVCVAEGPCTFTVRFGGLTAKTGTLQLRVHMLIEGDRPQLVLGNSSRTQFNRLIQSGSELSIHFDGFRRVRYALYGNILGASDAAAETIAVTLDRPGSGTDDGVETSAELRNSEFGQGKTRALASMISVDMPTLAAPVCQAATLRQMRERAFSECSRRAGLELRSDRTGWIVAYVLQALQTYGVMAAGARGVGFGPVAAEIATALGRNDIDAIIGDPPEAAQVLPGRFVNFDFLWSVDIAAKDGVNETTGYFEAYMKSLRPGGLAVHIVPFIPSHDQRQSGVGTGVFLRADVERLVLQMIAHNFETAQLKVACEDSLGSETEARPGMAGAFGFIFRKPTITGA